jgi:hypothetical protein
MTGMRILVTYAGAADRSDRFWSQRQRHLNRTALRNGFDAVVPWSPSTLRRTGFYARNRAILDRERGSGYWAWKPYIIYRALRRAPPGSTIVYWDVGRAHRGNPRRGHRFRRPIDLLIEWSEVHNAGILPGVYIPEHGPNRRWTKRDCFVLMGCDSPRYWEHPQVQASFSLWRRSEQAIALVHEWMMHCTDPRLVTDDANTCGLPDLSDFVDHRHDQSVLTNLVLKHGLRCYGSPNERTRGSKSLNALLKRLERERGASVSSLRWGSTASRRGSVIGHLVRRPANLQKRSPNRPVTPS